MSSLMPSTSTLLLPSTAGEGGGESSVARFGFSSLMRMVVVRGGLIKPDGRGGGLESCERLDFLTGGSSPSTTVLGGDGCEAVRDRFGTMMPSSDSDSDFRRVL